MNNLPPGITERDLPGCSDQDEWSDEVFNYLDQEVVTELENGTDLMSYFESFDAEHDPQYVAEKLTERFHEMMGDA